MAVILKQFASSAAFVDSPEQARDLYFEAALLPRSVTRVVLGEKGISVADVFRGSDPSKAVLLHACVFILSSLSSHMGMDQHNIVPLRASSEQ